MSQQNNRRTRRGFLETAGVAGSALSLGMLASGTGRAATPGSGNATSKSGKSSKSNKPNSAPGSPQDGTGVTRLLAEFVVNAQPAKVPAGPRSEALRSVLNYVGCAVGGSGHETIGRAMTALKPYFGPGQATILGRKERADLLHAALFNGMTSHVLDFDDTQLSTIIHPAGPVASAILPLAEKKRVSGRDFLHAFVLGVEVECRVGKVVYPSHYHAGWHITGTVGVFGAAAAAGKLLGLNSQQMTWALGIAATQSSGFKEMFGTMCKPFHPGHAAQCGLTAALLAGQDFTSTEAAIEARQGFAHVMAPERDFGAITHKLGETWEVSENTYKPFACGIVIHPIIDACRQLRNEHHLNVHDITRVDLQVNHYALSLTGKQRPTTGLEAKFSLYHSAAVALIRGAATPAEYTDAVARDPAVVSLRDRVHARVDDAISEAQAVATITLKNGKTLRKRIEHAVGSLENPMSDDDLEKKFRDLAHGVLSAPRIDRLIAQCRAIESLSDMRTLTRLAVPTGRTRTTDSGR